MSRALLAISIALLAGCASAPPSPESVRFAQLEAPRVKVALVDHRTAAERLTRAGRMGDVQYHYLGDLAMQPSVVEAAAAAVAAALPESLRNSPIELRRVEVGFWRARVSSSGGGSVPFVMMPGAPVGAVVLGNIIGHGIVAAVSPGSGGKGYPFAGAVFEFNVGEERLGSYDNVVIDGSLTPEQALERAVAAGIATLRKKAADLPAPAAGT